MSILSLLHLINHIWTVFTACASIEVRKEWRDFSTDEQAAWINAVKCMAKLPHKDALVFTVGGFSAYANITSNSSYYDDFVYAHSDLNPLIHFTGLFLPFHRFFVWSYTQSLKNDCGYTGVAPYWDWTLDSCNVKDATIWSDDMNSGLGQATGIADKDYEVATGGFATNFTLAYPGLHNLRRNFTLRPWITSAAIPFVTEPYLEANATFTPKVVAELIANYTGDFKGFQSYMEGFQGPHGAVHLTIGGDLGGSCPASANAFCFANEGSPTFSPNEPMFWMHHAMVDRIWWQWQNAHPENKNAFFGGSVQNLWNYVEYPNGAPPLLGMQSVLPTAGLMREVTTLGDVWETEGHLLCYTYK